MIDDTQYRFIIQLLTSDFYSIWTTYSASLEELELKRCIPDKSSGKNHCVYEIRFSEAKYVKMDGKDCPLSIDNIILPSKSHAQKNQILCIEAPTGYAKEFFADCICRANLVLPKKAKASLPDGPLNAIRLPLIIRNADLDELRLWKQDKRLKGKYSDLCLLCAIGVERVLREKKIMPDPGSPSKAGSLWMRWIRKKLLSGLRKLLDTGRVFILFRKETIVHIQEIEEIVRRDLPKPKSEDFLNDLLVFVFDDACQNPFSRDTYSIRLTDLSRKEVMQHIEFCCGKRNQSWSDIRTLVARLPALQTPDLLLFVTETHLNNENYTQVETAAELYHDCIDAVLKERCPDNMQKTLWELQEYALSTYLGKDSARTDVKEQFEALMEKPSKTNHLLRKNGSFRFEGCRECLAAERLYDKFSERINNRSAEIPHFSRSKDGNLVKRLIEITTKRCRDNTNPKDGAAILDELWLYLTEDKKEQQASNLDSLICFMEYIEKNRNVDFDVRFIDEIKRQLAKPVYDSHVFHLIAKADIALSLKTNVKLKTDYLTEVARRTEGPCLERDVDKDRYIRRLLFYFGRYDRVDSEMLTGWTSPLLDPHIKYHLARAMVDNALHVKDHTAQRQEFEQVAGIEEASGEDPILNSYYLTLQRLLWSKQPPENVANSLRETLRGKLHDKEYWIRGHAADALGQHGDLSDVKQLTDALSRELHREEEDNIKLKAVNYMTEAVCGFFFYYERFSKGRTGDSANSAEIRREAMVEMLKMIDADGLACAEKRKLTISIYATLADGVLYLSKDVCPDPPDFGGRHIPDGLERWDENVNRIAEAFELAYIPENSAVTANYKAFQEKIREIRSEASRTAPPPAEAPPKEPAAEGPLVINAINSQINMGHGRGIQYNNTEKGDDPA